MTDQHLINRIKFFKRKLENWPSESYYVGDSDYAEDAVKAENVRNEVLADDIREHIADMKRELSKRKGGELIENRN